MKRIFISLYFILIIAFSVTAQTINEKVWDQDLEENILTGKCDRQGLEEGEFGEIFKSEYDEYYPDKAVIDEIKENINKIKDFKIIVVFGVWCSDSQREVPRFFKLLDDIGIPEDEVTIYAVNRKKEGGDVDLSKYKIDYVPTFIIYVNGKEKGRIVESPEETLEKDLLNIVKF